MSLLKDVKSRRGLLNEFRTLLQPSRAEKAPTLLKKDLGSRHFDEYVGHKSSLVPFSRNFFFSFFHRFLESTCGIKSKMGFPEERILFVWTIALL